MRTITLLSASLAILATQLHAGAIITYDFEANTAGDLNGQSGFTADTAVDVVAGGLSYAAGSVSSPGGSQNILIGQEATNNAGTSAAFSNTFTSQSGAVYFSVAMEWSGISTDFLYFALSDDTDIASLTNSAGFLLGSGGDELRGRIRENSSTNTTTTKLADVATTTTGTQLVVGKLWKDGSTNYNTLDLWLNPTSNVEGSAGGTTIQIVRDMGVSFVDSLYLRGDATGIGASASVEMDNILLGTTFSDVVPVPEPSTYAIFAGLLALGAVMVRRRLRN
jgi:hypothetical protein